MTMPFSDEGRKPPRAFPRWVRWAAIGTVGVIVFIFAIIFFVGVSQNKTKATEWGCLYGGGLLEDKGLKKTIAPGTTGGFTIYDSLRTVPADVRDYIIDAEEGVRDPGATPIVLPVQARDVIVDGEEVESVGITTINLELQTKFMFNENVCLWDSRYGRSSDNLDFNTPQGEASGWTTWLKNNMYKRIQEAARPIVRNFDWLQLSTNASVRYPDNDAEPRPIFSILQDEVSEALEAELTEMLGASFFCGPGYAFDGDADGEIGTCPAIQVSITEITPENPALMENYEAIVANAEAQQKIASDRDRAIAEQQSASDIAQSQANETSDAQIAEAQAQSATQIEAAQAQEAAEVAQAEADEHIGVAQQTAQLAIAEAQEQVAAQNAENAELAAQGAAAPCAALEAAGVDCEVYNLITSGQYQVPTIVTGDSGSNFLLDIGEMMAQDPAPVTSEPAE